MAFTINDLGCCPECGSSWDGGDIAQTYIKKRDEGEPYFQGKSDQDIIDYVNSSYSPPYKWSRLIGIEIQGHYDGISRWMCPDCKTEWDRFTGDKIQIDGSDRSSDSI